MARIPTPARRSLRSDALLNREKLLEAAAIAVRTRGERVPMAQVARLAGVGVGTLYRHFPTRNDLLRALTERSLHGVLCRIQESVHDGPPASDALSRFFEQTIKHRRELVLPLHGGPETLDSKSQALEQEIREALEEVLVQGREDGSLRADVTATDVIIAGAQLAQPLPHVAPWDVLARRQARVYLAGLRAAEDSPLPFSR